MTDDQGSTTPAPERPTRRVLAALFWLLASLSIMLGGLTLWAHQTLLTSSGWGGIVEDVVADHEVVDNISTVVVTRISDRLGVEDVVAGVLPDRLEIVGQAITAGVEDRVADAVGGLISDERVQTAIVRVNERGHDVAMTVIRGGDSEAWASDEGMITLNVFPIIETVLVALQEAGLIGADREIPDLSEYEPAEQTVALLERVLGRELPDDIGTIVLVDSENLTLVQNVVRRIDLITVGLLALAALFAALALWLAERRIRMVTWLAGGAFFGLAATRLLARLVFGRISDRAADADAGVTVLAIVDVALASLLTFTLALMFVALVVAIASLAWERWVSGGRIAAETPPRTLAGWARENARAVLIGGLALIGFVVLWAQGGPDLALGTASAVGLLLLAYHLLTGGDAAATEPRAQAAAAEPASDRAEPASDAGG